jgi:type I site-specific restriction endonuclease
MTDEQPSGERSSRVTNSDLDRRIDHLESIQDLHGTRLHELGNELAVVGLKVEHSQEMIRVRFTGLESKVDAMTAKVDALLEQNLNVRADATATPAGRQLLAKIEAIEVWQAQNGPILDSARYVMTAWKVVAGGSVLTTVAAVVAVLAALGTFSPRGPLP